MAQVVSHWPVAAEAQAQSQASPCGGVVNRLPLRHVFLQVLKFSLVTFTSATYPLITMAV